MSFNKACPVCETSFFGRLNQTYCSIKCKSIYNNQKAKDKYEFSSEINNNLKRNRFTLERLYEQFQDDLIPKSVLDSNDYQFQYFTHLMKDKSGKVGKGCFDYCLFEYNSNFKIVSNNE